MYITTRLTYIHKSHIMLRHVIEFHIPHSNIFHMHFFQSFGIAITGIIEILAAIILVFILLQTPYGLGAFLDHFMEGELVFDITLKGIHLDPYANI